MNNADKRFYEHNGYVLIKQAVPDRELDPLRSDIANTVDRKIDELFAQGLLSNRYADLPLSTRWSEANKEYPTKEQMWVRQIFGKAIYDLGVHPRIVAAVESLIGPEIRFNGDYHVRPKLPRHALTTVPWHQDAYYYGGKEAGNPEYPILSIWIPLVDVNEDNGCLQFVPGSHRWGLRPEPNQPLPGAASRANTDANAAHELDRPAHELGLHTHELDRQAISLAMSTGDMVVFDKLTFHRSLPNIADAIRWNVDLRYSPADQSFAWSSLGDEIDIKYPSFIVKSERDPSRATTWEQYLDKFRRTTDRYDWNGKRI